jgi:hypothetical protein
MHAGDDMTKATVSAQAVWAYLNAREVLPGSPADAAHSVMCLTPCVVMPNVVASKVSWVSMAAMHQSDQSAGLAWSTPVRADSDRSHFLVQEINDSVCY